MFTIPTRTIRPLFQMFNLENLPNELFLLIFSYLTKCQLIESFFQLNRRLNHLLMKFISHLNLSTILTKYQLDQYIQINDYIYSLTIDNYQIGKDFLEKSQFLQLDNLYRIKLIDNAIDLQENFLERFNPEILNLVLTSLVHDDKHYQFLSTSLKRLEMDFFIGEYAKKCLLNQFNFFSTSILVDIRITFSKLSEYFRLFNCHLPLHIEKVYVSIFSIDKIDDYPSAISLPDLIDFQLEICQIPFHLIEYLLPMNTDQNLQRLAFIGQTTRINAKSWKLLLKKYNSIERFDLHLSNVKYFQLSDMEEWKSEFPNYLIDYNLLNNSFRIHSSKFDRLERICLNECIENLDHIDYCNAISHLIIRSQYWCSSIDLSLKITNDLFKHFNHLKRLSTTYDQLKSFLHSKFLNQIEQLDLEFSEKYCFIEETIANELIHLKSISLSSMYDGIHELNLHSIIKEIFLKKFSQLISIYIDAIRIIDDDHVENSISQWYDLQLNPPIINYNPGQSLSIWF